MFETFADYMVEIDDMKRSVRSPSHGIAGFQTTTAEVNAKSGLILVAEDTGRVIGFIAGVMIDPESEDPLGQVPTKAGRMIELFVEENHRRRGVGTALMKAMEQFFTDRGCNVARVEVFEPNHSAHRFYHGIGYRDRVIDLIKVLPQ